MRDSPALALQGHSMWKPQWSDIVTVPLPEMTLLDRMLARVVALLVNPSLIGISGREHIGRECDPFVLALNHSSQFEAILVPAFLMLLRQGRPVHFLADWNFRLIPGVGLLYRRSGTITVAAKPARPRILTPLRELYKTNVPPMEQARRKLLDGRSIGIFPEGRVNTDPTRLLRGRRGAARLSLETGVAVVPAGIHISRANNYANSIGNTSFELSIGAPLVPCRIFGPPSDQYVSRWHNEIMRAIAALSGKSYHPHGENECHETFAHDPRSSRRN